MRRLDLPFVALGGCALAFFVALAVHQRGRVDLIQSDGLRYYAWPRSLVLDGDLDFRDDGLPPGVFDLRHGQRTPSGGPVNKNTIGLGLVELPAVAAARVVERALGLDPTDRPGWSAIYQWAVALYLVALGLLATRAAFRHLETRGCDPGVVFLLAAGTLWAANLLEYVTRGVSYTHLVDLALGLTLWRLCDRDEWRTRDRLAVGFLAALALLVRPTSVLLLPWLAGVLVRRGRAPRWRDAAVMAAGALGPLLAQVVANLVHRGALAAEPYPGEHFRWASPHLGGILFAPIGGWLLWHPWFLLLLALMAWSWSHYRTTTSGRIYFAGACASLVSLWYVHASWYAWDFGFSFGNRGFLALAAILTVTVGQAAPTLRAEAESRLGAPRARTAAIALCALLVIWNLYLWVGFLVATVAHHHYLPTWGECAFWPAFL